MALAEFAVVAGMTLLVAVLGLWAVVVTLIKVNARREARFRRPIEATPMGIMMALPISLCCGSMVSLIVLQAAGVVS